MKVMKFGGTSVGTPMRMKEVTNLVTKSGEPVFVVLSAMAGTTNSLVEISDYLYKKNPDGANEVINNLEQKYLRHISELYSTEQYQTLTRDFLKEEFEYLRSFTKELFYQQIAQQAQRQSFSSLRQSPGCIRIRGKSAGRECDGDEDAECSNLYRSFPCTRQKNMTV